MPEVRTPLRVSGYTFIACRGVPEVQTHQIGQADFPVCGQFGKYSAGAFEIRAKGSQEGAPR